jgi:hypothetical protein
MVRQYLYILLLLFLFTSCTDEIDKSNRYTFTGETIADYMNNRSEKYSHMIDIFEKAGLDGILSTYGRYTIFIADNNAVERFVREQDSIYHATKGTPFFIETGIHSPEFSDLSDSMANVIARTQIIDYYCPMAEMTEGALPVLNFNDKYLGVNYKVVNERFYVMINNRSAIIEGDNVVENGIIHVVDEVVDPLLKNVPELIASTDFFSIFNNALIATGLADSLTRNIDKSYLPSQDEIPDDQTTAYFAYPIKKFYRYTAFVETNEVFRQNGIDSFADLVEFAYKWYGTEDKDDFCSPRNALYKFVSYHFTEYYTPYNKIVPYGIKLFSDYPLENTMLSMYDRDDYAESMSGKVMRFMKPLSCTDGIDVFINYNKKPHLNIETNRHLSVRVIPLTEFTGLRPEYASFNQMATNGVVHPINKILVYDEDAMAGNILNDRIRIDVAALAPELSSNALRHGANGNARIWGFRMPENFSKSFKIGRNTTMDYWTTSGNYYADYFALNKEFDVSIRIPDLPSKVYEIRFGADYVPFSRNTERKYSMNVYLDGRPLRHVYYSIAPREDYIGWVPDDETYDNGVENDKLMRSKGWMKAPDVYLVDSDEKYIARNHEGGIRCIVGRDFLGPGEHWLRFRKLDNHYGQDFCLDYIELVPLNIIDGLLPEDTH